MTDNDDGKPVDRPRPILVADLTLEENEEPMDNGIDRELEANRAALADAGLEPGLNYSSVADGIREITKQRDLYRELLRRIKGVVELGLK